MERALNSANVASRFGHRTSGRSSPDELQIRKKAILRAATTLFIERGFIETTFCDIARNASVSTRTICSHYVNKEAVFNEAIDLLRQEAEHAPPSIELKSTLFDTLFDTAIYICNYSLSEQAIAFNRLMARSFHLFPQLIESFAESMNSRLFENVHHVFEQLAEQGTIPADDTRETAEFFIDLLLGVTPLQLRMNRVDFAIPEAEISAKIYLFAAGRFGLSPS